jgi:hypothetical protein
MIIYFIRALLILILLFVIIVDFDLPVIINTPINQLFIAIVVIFIIITVDEVIGFITGLIFLIIYFKYYQRKLYASNSSNSLNPSKSSNSYFTPGTFTSPFNSTPSVIDINSNNVNGNYNSNGNYNGIGNVNGNENNNENDNGGLNSFFNYFKGDTKPKSYSTQPEIPEHYIQEVKNNNESCTLIPYVSKELLNSAQNNIYNEENYKTEIKHDNNFYGIQGLNSDNTHYIAFDNNFINYTNL